MRPEVGTQAQFKKKKPPKTYRYDSSLSPALDWDAKNPAREQGEALIAQLERHIEELRTASLPSPSGRGQGEGADKGEVAKALRQAEGTLRELKALSKPFLNWAGKAERLSFDVPTLPLFIHERLSTKAIIETLVGHKTDKQMDMYDLFGDPRHSITDQVLKAYEYPDQWVNRMVLGDSLVVMNSLLHYEGLGGQVQMIYMDPPYGVKFGSNFQPFVKKRDVTHNDDEDMTREPEMVQAYRDTWELGLHSYLTYLRDRLLLARDLLTPSGSLFVQISDENLHHVREVLDEVFGAENFVGLISFQTKIPLGTTYIAGVCDYILWYSREITLTKFRRLFVPKDVGIDSQFNMVELSTGERRSMTTEEKTAPETLPEDARVFTSLDLSSSGRTETCVFPFEYKGKVYTPTTGKSWKTNLEGMNRLISANRLHATAKALRYVLYHEDFPVMELANVWTDTLGATGKHYVVQTVATAIQRCLLMTTDPGDLILDPTCGSGTTAYVAEQSGRRWITIDTSRVPLALARQRLLTGTFPWYELEDEQRGPAGGFVYKRKQNKKGEEVGGIVPHVTLGSITNNESPREEVLVDRPEQQSGITRVTGPFCFEATIPTPVDLEDSPSPVNDEGDGYGSFVDRMLEVLRKSPILRLEGNKTVTFKNVRPPAKTLSLSAEALVDATAHGQSPSLSEAIDEAEEKSGRHLPLSGKLVALVFGPENGAVSEKLVYEAAREAHVKSYTHLYVIGFAIQPNARTLVEKCTEVVGVPATYVQATPDLMMGDLLKNMRSSQIFSVCGQPEIEVRKIKTPSPQPSPTRGEGVYYQVELLGLDVFDPISMEVVHRSGNDVPAWFLDIDYNDLCFHVSQAFFPRTGAWNNLKKALKGEYEENVWDHLAGATSAPFLAGEHKQIAVKVIDDRGNELLVVKKLNGAGR
ncbi:MAG: DNA methyltransferase [Nitrospira sp.]|nr:DNA methyltransferase [Nitrospira sp.]